ncbi:PfkB family carbohydrate kinase [Microvirga rosea]|uniref:PfkB family carbohydrate kinase n=1 Tax=Microvirga rosea TaxID=2715425 RepID=UPI001D0B9D30|nr:PfkB family carbohydrate kinase [Microvirga rosea]MCB8820762.1 PfkB family carbohydrate kinase [Microvirga rosea]
MFDGRPVICVGCAFWDTIFKIKELPSRGIKVLPERVVQSASGMATAAAVTIARLGGAVDLWARVGDDAAGESFLKDLARETVRTGSIRIVPGARTAISTILVDDAGERIVVPYTDSSLDSDPSWLPLPNVAEASAVLADMRWPEAARASFAETRRRNIPSVLDADVAAPDLLREMIALADHVLFSEVALQSLVPHSSPQDALRKIVKGLRAKVVGVTLGAAGALIWQRDTEDGRIRRFPSIPIDAVDTLNAGDIWHGVYVYGLACNWDIERTVKMANIAAAMKCEHFGGRNGAPYLAELLERSRALIPTMQEMRV